MRVARTESLRSEVVIIAGLGLVVASPPLLVFGVCLWSWLLSKVLSLTFSFIGKDPHSVQFGARTLEFLFGPCWTLMFWLAEVLFF